MHILRSGKRQFLALISLIWLSGCADERSSKDTTAHYYPQNGAMGYVPGVTGYVPGVTGYVPGVTGYVPGVTIYTPHQTVQPQGVDPFAPNAMSPMPTTRVPVTLPSVPQRAPDYQPLNPGY
jgi:hypothetical protein